MRITALEDIEILADRRRQEILSTRDNMAVPGDSYYLSEEGDDGNDGLSPQRPWRSLERANKESLKAGDGLFLRRGDIFRGGIIAREGVSYGAYGEGPKPCVYGSEINLAEPGLWELFDREQNIWRCRIPVSDAGTLVFNEGEFHSRKLIPSYFEGRFVCRDEPDRDFDPIREMTEDLDIFCRFDSKLTTEPSRGENFPIPDMNGDCPGDLYLRCDRGNPGELFSSIEALARRHLIYVGEANDVRVDNLCLKYGGMHGVSAGGKAVRGLHVSNCEFGWIGGCIQHYLGTDPNYPQGGRGTVTRFGNAVEIYGGCEDYEVENCYIYQVYDAGITHQISCFGEIYKMERVRYHHNLIENCVYSIEYFLETVPEDRDSIMRDIEIDHNILRLSGFGWGQQRHNKDTPAHIKGWSYVNTAENYRICGNVFDRAAYRMLHLVALKEKSLPKMAGNVYAQFEGQILGQYGANETGEPPVLAFDDRAEKKLSEISGEGDSTVIIIK